MRGERRPTKCDKRPRRMIRRESKKIAEVKKFNSFEKFVCT